MSKQGFLKHFFRVFFPFACLILYLVFVQTLADVTGKFVWSSLVTDVLVIVIGVAVFLWFRICRPTETESFKPRAWAVFLWIFAVCGVWFITQCMSLCITLHVKDIGLEAYTNTIQTDVGLWVLLAVLFAPAAEEILFRGVIYRCWKRCSGRHCLSGIIATMLSSLLFAAIHGTLVHIPVAFLMGMFNVAVWEVTGKFRYAVLSHMIYNFLSIGAVIPISPNITKSFFCSIWFNVFIGLLLLAAIIALYVFHEKVRKFVTTPNLLDHLNRKWDEPDDTDVES